MGVYLFMHPFVLKPFEMFDLFTFEMPIQVCLTKTLTMLDIGFQSCSMFELLSVLKWMFLKENGGVV